MKMLLYAITARDFFQGNEQEKCRQVIQQAHDLARGGVRYLQIREKDLPMRELESLAEKIVHAARSEGSSMRVLLNGPPEIALQTACDGIHLTANASEGAAAAARQIFADAGRRMIVSAACHSLEDVEQQRHQADLLLFAPVFEKHLPEKTLPGVGLSALASAAKAAHGIPVIALGGITPQNAPACLQAGALGIGAIRLFMTRDWLALAEPHQHTRQKTVD